MTRRLVAVFAHPDDDTFAVSGTVAFHADDPGFRFTLIHATSGEAGEIADRSVGSPTGTSGSGTQTGRWRTPTSTTWSTA